MSLTLIAALTWPGRVIGKDNAIPWRLKDDLRRFKALTLGHPVVMGRRTWESLPFKLEGRTNIVLSGHAHGLINPKGASPDAHCTTLAEALAAAAAAPGGDSAYVIGGSRVYAEALPLATHLALTLVHHPFDGDALFPPFDPGAWREVLRERGSAAAPVPFEFEFLDLQRP